MERYWGTVGYVKKSEHANRAYFAIGDYPRLLAGLLLSHGHPFFKQCLEIELSARGKEESVWCPPCRTWKEAKYLHMIWLLLNIQHDRDVIYQNNRL